MSHKTRVLAHTYMTILTYVAMWENFAILTAAVSSAYQNIKLKGYDLLEERNKELVRKLNPCPKQYKRYEQYYPVCLGSPPPVQTTSCSLYQVMGDAVSVFSLQAFDSDIQSLVAEYKALPAGAQNGEILGSFERMWTNGREKLALRLGRTFK